MSFLLDTVVLSELRKKDRNYKVTRWILSTRPSNLFVSVVTIGELEKGIEHQKRKDPDFSHRLEKWLETILHHYQDRIISIDTVISRRWGKLCAVHGNQGVDLLIAATALEGGLTVVTRNVRHFEPTGVSILNPFE